MPRKNTSGVALGVLGMLLLLVVVIGAGRIGIRENLTAAESAELAKAQADVAYFKGLGFKEDNVGHMNNAAFAKAVNTVKRLSAVAPAPVVVAVPAPAPVVAVSASSSAELAKAQADVAYFKGLGFKEDNVGHMNNAAFANAVNTVKRLSPAAPAPVPVVVAPPTPAPVPVVVAPPTPAPVPVVVAPPAPAPVPVVVAPPAPVVVAPPSTPAPVVVAPPAPVVPTGTPAPASGSSLKPASSAGTGNASTSAATDEDDEGFLGGIYSYFFPESEAQKAKKAVEAAKEEERLAKLTPAQRKLEGEYSTTRLYRTIFPLNEAQQAKEDAEAAKEEARRAKLTPEERKEEDKKKLDTTSIVLISVGVIVVLAIVGMFVFSKSSSRPPQGGRRR